MVALLLAGDEARLHFLPFREKIEVLLDQALASNSPPDCCIEWFEPSSPPIKIRGSIINVGVRR